MLTLLFLPVTNDEIKNFARERGWKGRFGALYISGCNVRTPVYHFLSLRYNILRIASDNKFIL